MKKWAILFLFLFGITSGINNISSAVWADEHEMPSAFVKYCRDIYLKINDKDLGYECFSTALSGYQNLINEMDEINQGFLTIIDFSKPSTAERFFVVDLVNQKVLFKSLVSHGQKSGDNYATTFSNRMQSHMSSLGFYLTGESYFGKHGYSMKLYGLENEFNSNAYKRAVVVHAANYVTYDYINKNGRIGRSFGCPALPPDVNEEIINEE
ncbi:MAG: murein L,D-transpeptidase catalytic domain family protein [Bacteroidales bacterium]|nr:murein L,D-transpeptidase catalytic domain family protein [Bacteroidales bacterium]